jgi:hypothetical protein
MEFEFDQNKSQANLSKHGIDFKTARKLWLDSGRIEIPAKTIDEPRFLIISKLNGKYWSGIFTIRRNVIRIISVRRSRKNEIELYES